MRVLLKDPDSVVYVKGMLWQFGEYTKLRSCKELYKKTDSTIMCQSSAISLEFMFM